MKTKVRIDDRAALHSITPLELETYLEKAGWVSCGQIAEGGRIVQTQWEKGVDYVEVSHGVDSPRYYRRVQEALHIIAAERGHYNERMIYYQVKGMSNAFDARIGFEGRGEIRIEVLMEWDADIDAEAHDFFHSVVNMVREAFEKAERVLNENHTRD